MLLIAESGGTTTQWRFFEHGKLTDSATTIGLNPLVVSDELFISVIRGLPHVAACERLYFFGAGCGTVAMQARVQNLFLSVCPQLDILIDTDLQAAALASYGYDEKGVVGILGTGANSCLWEYGKITAYGIANGVWLGDEGSGAYFGKDLIIKWLNGELPSHLCTALENDYRFLSRDFVLNKVYREPAPNRFLASFAPFLSANKSDAFVHKMLLTGFKRFFELNICRYAGYESLPLVFVGSIAVYFADELSLVAALHGCRAIKTMPAAIDGLAKALVN